VPGHGRAAEGVADDEVERVGPLVAALFITVWGFYRETLRERLETPPAPGAG